jgi:hypothetical protein
MFLPIPDYIIVDIENRKLVVVAEATTYIEAKNECKKRQDDCEIYKEQGEEIYRCICRERMIVSEDITTK